MTSVVDANVVVKWFVADPLTSQAFSAREQTGGLLAPDLMLTEVANAFRRYVFAKDMTVQTALENLQAVRRIVDVVRHDPLLDEALLLGCRLNHSLQDCLYVVLALRRGLPFVTADAKLVRRFANLPGLDLRPLAH